MRWNAALTLASTCAASSSIVTPRSAATNSYVVATKAGRLGRPRRGTGASQGASVSKEKMRRDLSGRLLQVDRVLVGHVAGEADVVAPLHHFAEPVGQGEAMQDHGQTGPVLVERLEGVGGRLARMHHDGQAGASSHLHVVGEHLPLHPVRPVIVVVVEAGLPHGDHAWVGGHLLHLGETRVVQVSRLVRMEPHGGVDLWEPLGQLH